MKPTKVDGKYTFRPYSKTGIKNLKSDHERAEAIIRESESLKSVATVEEYLKKFSVDIVYTLCMMDSIRDTTNSVMSSEEWSYEDWNNYMYVFWYDT